MIRNGCARRFCLITLTPNLGHDQTKWALRLALLRLPIQAISFTGVAHEFLRVLEKSVAVAVLHRVLALRIDDRKHRLNRKQLILADPTVENLLSAFGGVENVGLAFLHDRDGKGPILIAHDQNRVSPFGGKPVVFGIGRKSLRAPLLVGNGIAGK